MSELPPPVSKEPSFCALTYDSDSSVRDKNAVAVSVVALVVAFGAPALVASYSANPATRRRESSAIAIGSAVTVVVAIACFLVGFAAGSVELVAACATIPLLVQSLYLLVHYRRKAVRERVSGDKEVRCSLLSLVAASALIAAGVVVLVASGTSRFSCLYASAMATRLQSAAMLAIMGTLGGLLLLSLVVIRVSEHLLFSAGVKAQGDGAKQLGIKRALWGMCGSVASVRIRGPWYLSLTADATPFYFGTNGTAATPAASPLPPAQPVPPEAPSASRACTAPCFNDSAAPLAPLPRHVNHKRHRVGLTVHMQGRALHTRSESLSLPMPQRAAIRGQSVPGRRTASDHLVLFSCNGEVSCRHHLEDRGPPNHRRSQSCNDAGSQGGPEPTIAEVEGSYHSDDDDDGGDIASAGGGTGIFSRALKRIREEAYRREEHKAVTAAVLNNNNAVDNGVDSQDGNLQIAQATVLPQPPKAYLRLSRLHPLAYSVGAACSAVLCLLFLKIVLEGLKAVTYGVAFNSSPRNAVNDGIRYDGSSHVGLFITSAALSVLFWTIQQRLLSNAYRFFEPVYVLPVFITVMVVGCVLAGGFLFSYILYLSHEKTAMLLASAALLMVGAMVAADNAAFLVETDRQLAAPSSWPSVSAGAGNAPQQQQHPGFAKTGRSSSFELLSFPSSSSDGRNEAGSGVGGEEEAVVVVGVGARAPSPALPPFKTPHPPEAGNAARRAHFLRREWGTVGVTDTPKPMALKPIPKPKPLQVQAQRPTQIPV